MFEYKYLFLIKIEMKKEYVSWICESNIDHKSKSRIKANPEKLGNYKNVKLNYYIQQNKSYKINKKLNLEMSWG